MPDPAPNAGAWTPAKLGGRLALWLDGSVGVTTATSPLSPAQRVSAWADQSGAGNAERTSRRRS